MGNLVIQFQGQIVRAAANNRVCGHASTCRHAPTSPNLSWTPKFYLLNNVYTTLIKNNVAVKVTGTYHIHE